MTTRKLCLNMIVKNEAHIIQETFDNLFSYLPIDYWVISDTGSTDNTKDLIKDYFKNKNIPGELVEHEWRDFGYNRSKALECAYNKTDYLLIFDADDKICGDFKLPSPLQEDMYQLQFGKEFTYLRPLLVNNRKRWEYKGVLHEFISSKENSNGSTFIGGNYYIDSGRLGDRSKNPNKYRDDAIVLEKAFEKEQNETKDVGMACRYAFYCAQSYKDAAMPDKAIEWYDKCLTLPNWTQEKYYSALTIATLYVGKGNIDKALTYYYKTVQYDSERIEGIVMAMELLLKKGDHLLVNCLYHRFKNYKREIPPDKLFVIQPLYKDKIEFMNSISSSYVNDKEAGYQSCKKILQHNELPEEQLIQTVKNLFFYKDAISGDLSNDFLSFFEKVDKLIFKHKINEPNISQVWKMLYEHRKKLKQDKNKNKSAIKLEDHTIKIINCDNDDNGEKKESMVRKLIELGITKEKFDFVNAIRGADLQPNFFIKTLFRNNEFNYDKDSIAHALSHVELWKQLLYDTDHEYYVIMEDDASASFCSKLNEYLMGLPAEIEEKDVVFLGYHMKKEMRDKFGFVYNDANIEVNNVKINELSKKLYIGGVFAYTISKIGARKLMTAVEKHGIQKAVDLFMTSAEDVECFESRPQFVFSDMVEENTTDTQEHNVLTFPESTLENGYIFLQGKDQVGNDMYITGDNVLAGVKDVNYLAELSSTISTCVGFNTWGYFKTKIEKLEKVSWFSEKDGIYIKRDVYEKYLTSQLENITIDISE